MKWLLYFLFFGITTGLSYGVNPVKEYVELPGDFDFEYEEVSLLTKDGVGLKAWLCMPEPEQTLNTVLVLAYGDSGNMSYWLRQTAELVRSGFTIVLFDYRGFGTSEAFEMDSRQLYYDAFTTDLETALLFAQQRFESYRVGLWALSMGSIMGTLVADQGLFDFMVSEGFVLNPIELVDKVFQYNQEVLLLPESAARYSASLSKMTVPVLLFCGDRDGLTTVAEQERVKFLNPQSELVIYKGGHLQGFQALSGKRHGEKYSNAMVAFSQKL